MKKNYEAKGPHRNCWPLIVHNKFSITNTVELLGHISYSLYYTYASHCAWLKQGMIVGCEINWFCFVFYTKDKKKTKHPQP